MIQWLQVLGSTVAWTALYFTIKHIWKFEPEPTSRIVAAVHGLVATLLSGVALATGPWPFTDPVGDNLHPHLTEYSYLCSIFYSWASLVIASVSEPGHMSLVHQNHHLDIMNIWLNFCILVWSLWCILFLPWLLIILGLLTSRVIAMLKILAKALLKADQFLLLNEYNSMYTNPFHFAGGPNTPQQVTTLSVCLGYFLYDLAWCLCHQTEGVTMIAHHITSIIAIGRIIMKGCSGAEASAGAGGLECTNPLLQLRWFIRNAGYKDHLIYKVVELTFMSSFVFMRIIAGSYLLFSVLTSNNTDVEARCLAIALYAISWVFMVSIANHFYKHYIKGSKVSTD
ncbi:uncharacterized protein LOC124158173 [Ischnura elegans]|uniref:uncharacterized protein LOC124158173 n=1 Tax=Ischnura elegans TaxID=197161 RepID=UPI001ED86ECE|nr:uncharacterized protein LOC124158173 [Ischnura elegans]